MKLVHSKLFDIFGDFCYQIKKKKTVDFFVFWVQNNTSKIKNEYNIDRILKVNNK